MEKPQQTQQTQQEPQQPVKVHRRRTRSQSLRKKGANSPARHSSAQVLKGLGRRGRKRKEGEPIPLEHCWTFWFDGKTNVGMQAQDYSKSVVGIGSFDSIQDFWRYWNNIEPWNFANNSNLRLFKQGIKPMWEDKSNINGGRWVIQCGKEMSGVPLGRLVLGVIGEQFYESEKLCGVVFQVRAKFDLLSLWTSVSGPDDYIEKMLVQMRSILELPDHMSITFVLHKGSIEWNKGVSSQNYSKTAHKRNPSLDSSLSSHSHSHSHSHSRSHSLSLSRRSGGGGGGGGKGGRGSAVLTSSDPEREGKGGGARGEGAVSFSPYYTSPSTISLSMGGGMGRKNSLKSPCGIVSFSSSPSVSASLSPAGLQSSDENFSVDEFSEELTATMDRIRSGGSLDSLEEQNDPEVEQIASNTTDTKPATTKLSPSPKLRLKSPGCALLGAATTVVVGVAAVLAVTANGMLIEL